MIGLQTERRLSKLLLVPNLVKDETTEVLRNRESEAPWILWEDKDVSLVEPIAADSQGAASCTPHLTTFARLPQ